MNSWLAAAYETQQQLQPPYAGWTPHEWILALATLLLLERAVYWAKKIQEWATAHKNPDAPTTKAQVLGMLADRTEAEDKKRTEAVGHVQHMVDELKNSILLEMRPWKADLETIKSSLVNIEAFEKAKANLIQMLKEGQKP